MNEIAINMVKDWLGHLLTLSAGFIAVLVTFTKEIFEARDGSFFYATLGLLSITIIASLLALVFLTISVAMQANTALAATGFYTTMIIASAAFIFALLLFLALTLRKFKSIQSGTNQEG